MQRQRGLTLLELLVVLAIIGFATAGVSLSLRNNNQTQLEREAQRLIAVLEAARVQSRTSGIPLIWQTTPEGFVIQPSSPSNPIARRNNNSRLITTRTETWLTAGTQAIVSNTTTPNWVILGPEPLLTPTRITLSMTAANNAKATPTLSIGTDGLKPFQVLP